MKTKNLLTLLIILCCTITLSAQKKNSNAEKGLTPVTFDKVTLQDQFWSNRIKLQKEVLVPVALERTHGAVEDLQKTANYLNGIEGPLPAPHRFNISDLFKVLEGAAYLLKMERDPALEKQIDDIAVILAQAQEKDGYIYPAHTTGTAKDHEHWGGAGMGDKKYSWVVHSHELYNIGHLYEAAAAYYQATGKRNLLDIAEKSARHVNKVFFHGDPEYNDGKPVNQAPGHQEIEMALVKMYRVTNDTLYLNMAKRFVDIRGITYVPDGEGTMSPEYAQQHAPVRDQKEAVGHSVRATYLYSGMADVGALTNDPTLTPALHRIWGNIVDTRMHITGGLGAIHGIEGFGPEYELPNKDAYDETCAAVGNVFFNHRMFLLEKDGKYMDVAEVALLNNVLAGVNLGGDKFFYVNPLESDGMIDRSYWFGTACCPTNLARLIPQISGLMYSYTDKDIYCAFYTSSAVDIPLKGGVVKLNQQTNYPFDENIKLTVNPAKKNQQFAVKMRIPTWTGSQFVPGKLYHYVNDTNRQWEVYVNGKKVDNAKVEKGFVSIDRKWNSGDEVELRLPMPVRYTHAIEQVKADNGRVAITRGPLVYCAEGVDNEGEANRYYIEDLSANPTISAETQGLLKGIDIIKNVPAKYLDIKGQSHASMLTLVPYYAWNNRDVSTMNIWFAESESVAKEGITILPVFCKDIQASHTHSGDNLLAIINGKYPKHSFDTSIERWTSFPQRGKAQYIDFTFEKPTDISAFSVYWYDDKGGVQLPVSWNLQYKDSENGEWKDFPLYTTDSYSILKDQFNLVHSDGKSFVKQYIRLNMQAKDDSAVGILQVKFDTK
ncbi:glycoside hydrolase family 127 protein [Dysgonomonas sp. 25]|uniref:glycoside hydrolase family 127 protein n=1 Tax=Dysgonomonas sp. 25 TaxID=2302933 RepID=UPI0013D6863F|nr:beta-L-arabinofuranosidase domain-containing protein [Dysgonomonas sp. 25]NDV69533.1 hypothetical protein [Dysgonomonas sp. 25]